MYEDEVKRSRYAWAFLVSYTGISVPLKRISVLLTHIFCVITQKRMKKLVLLIGCFSTLLCCNAQMYIPTDPKERIKTYNEYMGNCRESMTEAATIPNTPQNQNKYRGAYSASFERAEYCEKLEPDSAEPYKLAAICAFHNNNSKACYDNINKYFAITHTVDTTLLRYRAISYVGRCVSLPEIQYYDSAKRDLDTLINTYHMERLIIVRSYLNELFTGVNEGGGVKDTIYQYREKQDNDLYISKFGKDSYYHTVLLSH